MSVIEHEGDLTVFKELLALRDKTPESVSMRPSLVVLAGVLRGVYGGGGVRALERAGFSDCFASAVGISTGAPTIAYFLTKQAAIGTSIYYEECISGNFIRWLPRNFTDISFLGKVWRGQIGDKKIDTLALNESKTNAYVSVVGYDKDFTSLLPLKTLNDPVEAIVASCAIPGLYFGRPFIKGTYYVDGAMFDPVPIELVQKHEKPTSVLVFMNRPKGENDTSWAMKLYDFYVTHILRYTNHLSVEEKDARRQTQLQTLRESGIPYCIVYTDDLVKPFTMHKEKMMKAADMFEAYILKLIDQAGE